jgi:hypothetical protein
MLSAKNSPNTVRLSPLRRFGRVQAQSQNFWNCSDNSICIIHQSKEHKILAEKFKIEENICLNWQNSSMNL